MYIRLSFVLRFISAFTLVFAMCMIVVPYANFEPGTLLASAYSFLPVQIGCAPAVASISLFVMAWMADRLVKQDEQIGAMAKEIKAMKSKNPPPV